MTDWGEKWPDVSDRGSPSATSPARYSVEQKTWNHLNPSQKQAALLAEALDYKRELISIIRTYPINLENITLHTLGARVADSTINQTLQLEANALQRKTESDEIEKIFEERQRRAMEEIARLTSSKNTSGVE